MRPSIVSGTQTSFFFFVGVVWVPETSHLYVCSNEECCYPVGEEVEPLIVKRDISQLLSKEKKSSLMESTFLQHSTASGMRLCGCMQWMLNYFLVVSFLSLTISDDFPETCTIIFFWRLKSRVQLISLQMERPWALQREIYG